MNSPLNQLTSSTPNGFGKIIRHYRERANLTQQQLKNRLESHGYPVAKSAICMWENGKRSPKDLAIIHHLGECLGLDPEREMALLNAWIIDQVVRSLTGYLDAKKGLASTMTYYRIRELISQTLESAP